VTGPVDELGRRAADQHRILSVLTAHGVEYLLAGGLAVIAHGFPRFTADVDVIPDPSVANLRRLAAALAELEAEAVGARDVRLALDLTQPESLALGNYFLDTKFGALDLLNGPRPDLHRYRSLTAAAVDVSVEGLNIRVISKDDLIAMKREAGRPKDLADIAALTEVERNRPDRDQPG
jgi:Nucleotidyl transferase AbiEii toxin, Type IV TA system